MLNPNMHKVLTGAYHTLFGAAIGFGVSQATLAVKVNVNETRIAALEEKFREDKATTNERILKLASLMEKSMDLTKEVIIRMPIPK